MSDTPARSGTEKPVRFEFVDFVGKFPPVAMPVTLGEESHHVFSTENEPLTRALIEQFILPYETTEEDEYTEYVPCFAIDCDEPFIALVWWKAGLLNYEYYLATFTEKGQLLDRKVIAFTLVNGQEIRRGVATIDEELNIHIAEGIGSDDLFDATTTRTVQWEIMPDGKIG